ncbi:hypothetical protein NX059_008077 [Plenodomus lindquistii]|nr:hypothetical protein NX059_008077 [Plenodomus lindquistii]
MSIKIYGSMQSTLTQRVIFTALELGIDYQLHDISMERGEHKSASYISTRHPFGRIPALEDGEIRIFESRAICRYLVAKSAKESGKTALYHHTDEAVAVGEREELASVEYSYFDPSMGRLGYEKLFKRFMGRGEANEDEVAAASRELSTALDYFEKVLADRAYLCGQHFGLFDVYVAPWIHFLPMIKLEQELSSRSALQDWWARVSARPAWKDLVKLLQPAQ